MSEIGELQYQIDFKGIGKVARDAAFAALDPAHSSGLCLFSQMMYIDYTDSVQNRLVQLSVRNQLEELVVMRASQHCHLNARKDEPGRRDEEHLRHAMTWHMSSPQQ